MSTQEWQTRVLLATYSCFLALVSTHALQVSDTVFFKKSMSSEPSKFFKSSDGENNAGFLTNAQALNFRHKTNHLQPPESTEMTWSFQLGSESIFYSFKTRHSYIK
jgi:hypothetical protein